MSSKKSSARGTPLTVWDRLRTPGCVWEDNDEFLDVIYWGRQILGVLMGLVWGLLGLAGFVGIALYVALNSVAVYIYSVNYNNDIEDVMEPVKEGFMTSFASFMVS
ncbi:hypothetical protein HDE_00155 [Halotydeus destructor]|nr:hypothetical protein HDE_00155 [Halotydeus destructor]